MPNVAISALTAGTTPTGPELIPVVQGGVTVKLTAAQIANIFNGPTFSGTPTGGALAVWNTSSTIKSGDLTGDVTTAGTPATTLAASGVTAGSYTNASITVDAKGRVTAASTGSVTGANPTATASDTAVNGVASTYMRSDAAPAVQKGSSSQFGIVKVDNTTITASAGVISGLALGTSTPLAPVAGGAAGSGSTAAKIDHQHPPVQATQNLQTGTTYTLSSTDDGGVVDINNASAITLTLPNSLPVGFSCLVCQGGAGAILFSAASGATIHQRQGFTHTAGQWAVVSLYVRANSGGSAAVYVIGGDMVT